VAHLLAKGLRPFEIADRLGVSRPTVSFHCRRLGVAPSGSGRRYDWAAVQAYYDAGHTRDECKRRFGFHNAAWTGAVARGAIVPRPAATPIEELLRSGVNRAHLRLRLIAGGLKDPRCEACGLEEWRGAAIPLQLHHVNGDGRDNRLENLQVLCANCHAQTANWSGRGKTRPAA
jgi:hypothetical protein